MMDIFEHECGEIASALPACYTSLMKAEQSIVDRLTVGYFVNRLMSAGELTPGISAELKPSDKSSNVGNSKKRPMNVDDFN